MENIGEIKNIKQDNIINFIKDKILDDNIEKKIEEYKK